MAAQETSKSSKLDALVRVYHQEIAGEYLNFCPVDIFPFPVYKKIPLNQREIQKKTLSNRHQKIQKKSFSIMKKPYINDKNRDMRSTFPLYMEDQCIVKMKSEKQFIVRQASYRDYLQVINFSNNLFVHIPPEKNIYKCHIGKGNNQMLIKSLMKMRWWWTIVESKNFENLNFLWTQIKKTDFLDNMQQLKRPKSTSSIFPKKVTPVSTQKSDDFNIINLQSNGQNIMLLKKLLNQDDYFILNEEFQQSKVQKLKIEALKDEDHVRSMKNSQNRLIKVYQDNTNVKICNHLEHNYHLGNKKALFYNLKHYCEKNKLQLFEIVPVTFHIQNGKNDEQYTKFIEQYFKIQKQIDYDQKENLTNTWIIKPGEQSNRGTGINILNDLSEIKSVLEQYDVHKNGDRKTYIVQKYIDNPLLYCKRKFDIRCYQLITSINGNIKGYWYQEGYVRTSSKDFSLRNLNKFIHLTNDAVQKKNEGYGKFEKGNKISFDELNRFINTNWEGIDFFDQVYPQMKEISIKTIKSAYRRLDPLRRQNGFELYGLDFMIDQNFKVWLLEENTNPALDICCSLLSKIIPSLIDNVLRIAVDPIFPPPSFNEKRKIPHENLLQTNKFELIFDEQMEEPCEDLIGYNNIEEEEDEDDEER